MTRYDNDNGHINENGMVFCWTHKSWSIVGFHQKLGDISFFFFFMDLIDRNGGVISTIIDNYRDIYIYIYIYIFILYIYVWMAYNRTYISLKS